MSLPLRLTGSPSYNTLCISAVITVTIMVMIMLLAISSWCRFLPWIWVVIAIHAIGAVQHAHA